MTPTSVEAGPSRAAVASLAADVIAIVVFASVGRRSHAEHLTVLGILHTAWPFLAGVAVGWLLSRAWRFPAALLPTGVTVWLSTVVVGMLLRKATGEGTATSFIIVATTATAVLLLGWRGVWRLRSAGR